MTDYDHDPLFKVLTAVSEALIKITLFRFNALVTLGGGWRGVWHAFLLFFISEICQIKCSCPQSGLTEACGAHSLEV